MNCAGEGGSIYSKVLLFILTFSLNRQQTTEEKVMLPNCVLQVWNTRTTPSKGSLNKTNAWVLLRILQFKCLSLGPSRVVLLTGKLHILVKLPVGNWHLWLMTGGSFQQSLLCIACIALAIPWAVFFIFWIHFWCMIPAMQKTLLVCGWKDIFYSKTAIIASSFSWKFYTDEVFSLLCLFCKWIDFSMEWLKSAWIHVLKTLM